MNNKGFAISGILYGVLLLFLMVLLGILSVLVSRIKDLDEMVEETSKMVENVGCVDFENTENRFLTKERGKYEIKMSNGAYCYSYLPKNILLIIDNGKLKYIKPDDSGEISLINLSGSADVQLIDSDNNTCTNANFSELKITKICSSVYAN